MQVLARYAWPGNVRELENMMERAVALAAHDEVGVENLPPLLTEPPAAGPPRWEVPASGMDLERALADLELALMRDALDKAQGIQTHAAKLLGLNFRSFRYRAKKYGLYRPGAHGDG
jgi:two-component system response regulator PilR (NtrC family)